MPIIGVGAEAGSPDNLRLRALSRLTGRSDPPNGRGAAVAALAALHELASSPSTAPNALALLHELQVHQVELDLQEEELRRSRMELETTLNRQLQLYDRAPVGYFTVDRRTILHELNLSGAQLLGFERDFLLGRSLDSFLTPSSGRALDAMLAQLATGSRREVRELQLRGRDGASQTVVASADCDPAGGHFLVAFTAPGPRAAVDAE